MGHGHDHGRTTAAAHRGRLAVVLGLTVAVLVVELVGAAVSGSLALLADAGHMATDAAGIALALGAVTLAQRPARGRPVDAELVSGSHQPDPQSRCRASWP